MRVIPAYAGSTYIVDPYTVDEKDHPRVCGEHTTKNDGNTPISLPKTDEKLQFKHSSLIKQHN